MGSSRYINKEGILSDAKRDAIALGGQIFQPRTGDDPVTLRVGNTTYTYWPPGSKEKREKLLDIADALDVRVTGNPWNLTSGRLIRLFLEQRIKPDPRIDPKGYARYFGAKYKELAQKGTHREFKYVKCDNPCYAIEWDIEAAFFQSLISRAIKKDKTLFLHEKLGYRPDNGALLRLESYSDVLNKYKQIRQQLIGIIQQYEIRYQIYDEETQQFVEKRRPKFVEINGIEVGGLFNAIHQALQDVYTGMQHSAQMLGQYLIRAKTDCLLVRADCPIEIEEQVVRYWREKGFRLKCKKDRDRHRFGWSYFSPTDVDLGFIHGIPIGSSNEVKRLIEQRSIEIRNTIPQEIVNRWQHWLD